MIRIKRMILEKPPITKNPNVESSHKIKRITASVRKIPGRI